MTRKQFQTALPPNPELLKLLAEAKTTRGGIPDRQWSVILAAIGVLEAHGFAPASGPTADLAQAIVEAVEKEIAKHVAAMENPEWSPAGAAATEAYQLAAKAIRGGFA